MWDRIKLLITDDGLYYGTIIVLVGVISFGLGRWSVSASLFDAIPHNVTVSQSASLGAIVGANSSTASPEAQKVPLEQIKTAITPSLPVPLTSENALYVGSKSGEKYHLLTCPGAKQIKEENKIFFASKEDAMKNGYGPASNCKGI
jgi:hypothetical protein